MIKRVNRFQAGAENKYFSGCMDKWKALAVSRKEFLELVKGRECYNGEDLSKCIDLTASGFVFRLDGLTPVETKKGIIYPLYAVCAHGFIPEDTVTKHEHTDRVPYRYWADNGWCTITPGAVTDDREIKSYLHDMEFGQGWKIKEICFDPYGARQFANEMGPEGEGYTVVEIRQGFTSLSEPTKKLRELALQGKIVHDGSPLLTWCLGNAIELTAEGQLIKLSKKHKDDTQRIDLVAAIINALFRSLLSFKPSIYEQRGMRSLL
jgi:phage terminase large subunit-like protein